MSARFRRPTAPRPAPAPSRRREALHPAPDERRRDPEAPEEREVRAGGPQDRALYSCACGATFQAPVSASVRCPHCSEPQAW